MDLTIAIANASIEEIERLARLIGRPSGSNASAGEPTVFGDGRRAMLAADRPAGILPTQHQMFPGTHRFTYTGHPQAGYADRAIVTQEGSVFTERFVLLDKTSRDHFAYDGWNAEHLKNDSLPTDEQIADVNDDSAGITARDNYVANVGGDPWIGKLVYSYQAAPTASEIANLAPTPSSYTTRTFKVSHSLHGDKGRLFREIHETTYGELVVDEYWLLDPAWTPPAIGQFMAVERIVGASNGEYVDLKDFLSDKGGNAAYTTYIQGSINLKLA